MLVNDILDVARLDSGRLELNLKPIPLNDIIADGLESYAETARRVGVVLGHEGEEPLVVMADPERLIQVLYNLVGNALKFTPAGGHVTVRSEQADGAALVHVTDTGPGLSKEQMGRLFQPFSRVHDTQQSTVAGTGLGLFICKGIMDAHGGSVTVASPGPGKGATFTVRIPLAAVGQAPEPRARPKPKQVDALAERLRELI
jgi:signal transduction histidine kinase